jgi:hypothetical protein
MSFVLLNMKIKEKKMPSLLIMGSMVALLLSGFLITTPTTARADNDRSSCKSAINRVEEGIGNAEANIEEARRLNEIARTNPSEANIQAAERAAAIAQVSASTLQVGIGVAEFLCELT